MKFWKSTSICFLLILLLLLIGSVHAQMKRELYKKVKIYDTTFWTSTLYAQSTTNNLEAHNLNVTIMHSFGLATSNIIQDFFGLDNPPNVRLGFDYGITNRWEAGIGRSTFSDIVDLRSKYAILQQKSDDSMPISFTLKGDVAVVTQENQKPLRNDLSSLVSAIFSRRLNGIFDFQVSPMIAHFNDVRSGNIKNIFSIGLGSQIHLSKRFSLVAEYYPVFGNRNRGTKNSFAIGLDIQTGGHVFQLFFTSSYWHLEQYILAQNTDQFWSGDFRFGFNINRLFDL